MSMEGVSMRFTYDTWALLAIFVEKT